MPAKGEAYFIIDPADDSLVEINALPPDRSWQSLLYKAQVIDIDSGDDEEGRTGRLYTVRATDLIKVGTLRWDGKYVNRADDPDYQVYLELKKKYEG
jgi:hypothetical protein